MREKNAEIKDLVGKRIMNVEGEVGGDVVMFVTDEEEVYKMLHYQDCCESVYVESIDGDLKSLIGNVVLTAEEVSNDVEYENTIDESGFDSFTWTFYKLSSAGGYITIRWLGESNGYYSESVDFIIESDKEDTP